jgi:hypothetical protein
MGGALLSKYIHNMDKGKVPADASAPPDGCLRLEARDSAEPYHAWPAWQ